MHITCVIRLIVNTFPVISGIGVHDQPDYAPWPKDSAYRLPTPLQRLLGTALSRP
ncbi:MAG: hypothetical protein OXE42_10760 [Gammaproteobacteria bacterium]|nr:hypothetical protein [Gammaproteobacteria bacterium]